jgi:hypothetical protein
MAGTYDEHNCDFGYDDNDAVSYGDCASHAAPDGSAIGQEATSYIALGGKSLLVNKEQVRWPPDVMMHYLHNE